MRRRFLLILLVLALGGGFGAGPAYAEGGDNAAVAIDTKDGTSVFRLAFAIKRVAGDVVDSTNAAVAYSSCTDCSSVAIAIEVVLVSGSPTVVTPTNLALALNESCQSCVSVADAYQFVLGNGEGQVHFTEEGNRMLAEIRRDLEQLRNEDLTLEQLQAGLDDIIARLKYILETQLIPAGESGGSGAGGGGGGGPPGATTTATTPTETQAQPTETASATTETTTEATTTSTSTDTATTTTP